MHLLTTTRVVTTTTAALGEQNSSATAVDTTRLVTSTPAPTSTASTTTTPVVACLQGEFIGDNTTSPITCYSCKHGPEYDCGQGRYRNGTACSGTGVLLYLSSMPVAVVAGLEVFCARGFCIS